MPCTSAKLLRDHSYTSFTGTERAVDCRCELQLQCNAFHEQNIFIIRIDMNGFQNNKNEEIIDIRQIHNQM